MTTNELLNYLAVVIKLERDKYTLECIISELNSDIKKQRLQYDSNKTYIAQVSYANQKSDEFKKKHENKFTEKKASFLPFVTAYLGLALCGFFVSRIIPNAIGYILGGAVGAVIGFLIPYKIEDKVNKQKANKEFSRIERIDNERKELCIQTNKKLEISVPKLEKEKKAFYSTYQMAVSTLNKYYSLGIIPPDYRKYVPVCMFYDYIKNGRCYSLTRNGSDPGAVNLYIEDLKYEKIMDSLHKIEANTEAIKQTQYVMYESIQENHRETKALLKDINNNLTDINSGIKTNQYLLERQSSYQEYMSRITYQSYMGR